jgi:hypothetical protein
MSNDETRRMRRVHQVQGLRQSSAASPHKSKKAYRRVEKHRKQGY